MNTTARIETNGLKNRIHLSQETADLIILAGKTSWIRPREDKVYAKGKGKNSYRLEILFRPTSSPNSSMQHCDQEKCRHIG
jgi:hypothetical protein